MRKVVLVNVSPSSAKRGMSELLIDLVKDIIGRRDDPGNPPPFAEVAEVEDLTAIDAEAKGDALVIFFAKDLLKEAQELKKRHPHCKVVVLTAEAYREPALEEGVWIVRKDASLLTAIPTLIREP